MDYEATGLYNVFCVAQTSRLTVLFVTKFIAALLSVCTELIYDRFSNLVQGFVGGLLLSALFVVIASRNPLTCKYSLYAATISSNHQWQECRVHLR